MIDYDLKSSLLNTGLVYIANKINRYLYMYYNKEKFNNLCYIPSLNKIYELKEMYFPNNSNGDFYFNECLKINNAYIKRKLRLENRIYNMLLTNIKCYFVTLTFSDDVLNNTTFEARKRRVREFLKEHYLEYVANVDYGSKNEREHYHAVVLYKHDFDYSLWYNKEFRNVRFNTQLIKKTTHVNKIAEYVSVLTNHAIKKSTKRQPLIYSRVYKKVITQVSNSMFDF